MAACPLSPVKRRHIAVMINMTSKMGVSMMNRTITLAALALSLLAQMAAGQMMGGGGNHQGLQPSNPPGAMGVMRNSLVVGTDGVIYTLRIAATTAEPPRVEVIAIRPSGAIAWTTKLDAGMSHLELSGNLVLVTSGDGDMGMDGWSGTVDDTARLVALSAASGTVQWQVDLDGFAAALEPFSGGVYVLIMQRDRTNTGNGMHNGSNGTRSMKRSVAAIDNAGKILWRLDLN